MDDFLMRPKVGFAFKGIMTDERARIGFLSAVLEIRPEDIRETRILNTDLRKEHEKQILSGQHYDVFKKCVNISILDFDFFRKEYDVRERRLILKDICKIFDIEGIDRQIVLNALDND